MTDVAHSDIARGPTWPKAGVASLLSLAATPTFAAMAFLTAVHGGDMPAMLCSAAGGGSPLTGMTAMYLLMSAFHLAPWLKLLSGSAWNKRM
jgi:hypothetical protein